MWSRILTMLWRWLLLKTDWSGAQQFRPFSQPGVVEVKFEDRNSFDLDESCFEQDVYCWLR
jgi:hypothetical protein